MGRGGRVCNSYTCTTHQWTLQDQGEWNPAVVDHSLILTGVCLQHWKFHISPAVVVWQMYSLLLCQYDQLILTSQQGHTNPSMFFTTPSIGSLILRQKFISLRMVARASSWGVVTMTAPSGLVFMRALTTVRCSSEVPGGVSAGGLINNWLNRVSENRRVLKGYQKWGSPVSPRMCLW